MSSLTQCLKFNDQRAILLSTATSFFTLSDALVKKKLLNTSLKRQLLKFLKDLENMIQKYKPQTRKCKQKRSPNSMSVFFLFV